MNRKHLHRWIAPVLALVMAWSGPALVQAQEETGNVFVVVTDTSAAQLPGVSVTLEGGGAPRVQITNEAGQVRFLGLDPGTYALRADLDGFSTVEYPAIDVRVARNTTLEVTLDAAVEEVITVTSESPLLDERKLSAGTTISQVELEKIPTARDPWSVLSQTPGVMVDRVNVGGNESGQQSTFTAPGVSDDENAFLVDGVEITDMSAIGSSATYYDFDQFTEMQFSTGGTDVTKSSSGVSVNLVTKRGTNEFRGSARFLRTDDDFFAGFLEQDVPVLVEGDPELGDNQSGFIGNSINQVTEYGFEAGGPVVRDRLWFWGSFGTNDIKNRTGGATQANVQSDDTILESSSLKVNAQLSGSNSAVASWNNGNKQKFGRNAGPTRPQPTTWDQRGPTAIYKVEDTHVFNSNFFLSGTWSHVDGGFSLTSKAVTAAGGLAGAAETSWDANGVWGNSFRTGGTSRPSDEVKLDGSYFFNTGSASHEIKFGGRLREFEVNSPFHWPGRDIFMVDLELFGAPAGSDIAWLVAHRGETPLISQEYTSFWVQDTISTGNLTVNAGLRYDLQDGQNEPFAVDANPAFPNLLPALSFDGSDSVFEWETVSPRLGLTYAVGEERKTLLRGSYAQFPEQLFHGQHPAAQPARQRLRVHLRVRRRRPGVESAERWRHLRGHERVRFDRVHQQLRPVQPGLTGEPQRHGPEPRPGDHAGADPRRRARVPARVRGRPQLHVPSHRRRAERRLDAGDPRLRQRCRARRDGCGLRSRQLVGRRAARGDTPRRHAVLGRSDGVGMCRRRQLLPHGGHPAGEHRPRGGVLGDLAQLHQAPLQPLDAPRLRQHG